MTLNDIVWKITRKNIKINLLFCFSIVFGIALFGANGILLFSTTVSNVLVAGGSTYVICIAMYLMAGIGISIFYIYLQIIYIKDKSEEIGLFLSLGLSRKDIDAFIGREFTVFYTLSTFCGLILSIPLSWLCWTIITLFLHTSETDFSIGWLGMINSALIVIIMGFILWFLIKKRIGSLSIISIIYNKQEQEKITKGNYIWGIIGLFTIPLGLILFRISDNSFGFMKKISLAFIILSVIGIYLVSLQITTIGDVFKRFCKRIYFKNLLFFNLVRQKGNQYTLTLFVATILFAITIFGVSFNSASFIGSQDEIKKAPFDYMVMTSYRETENFNSNTLLKISHDSKLVIKDMKEIKLLLMGREHHYATGFREWGAQLVINQSDFNILTGIKVEILDGFCTPFQENGNKSFKNEFQTFDNETPLTNPELQTDLLYQTTKGIVGNYYVSQKWDISNLVILNDNEFKKLETMVGSRYILDGYFFNSSTSDVQQQHNFYNSLLNKLKQSSDNLIWDNINEIGVVHKQFKENLITSIEDIFIPYEENELYAACWYSLYPFSKANALATSIETGAVYILLISFTCLVVFVAATLIISIKIISSIWQDKESYKKVLNLGLSNRDLSKLIIKQISLLFFFPAICGSFTGIFLINQIIRVTSVMSLANEITLVAVFLALNICIIQVGVFILICKNSIKEAAYVSQ